MGDLWTKVGPTLASLMFLSAVLRQYCPDELRRLLDSLIARIAARFRPHVHVTIHEFSGDRLSRSDAFLNVEAYLSSAVSLSSAARLRLSDHRSHGRHVLTADESEPVADQFKAPQNLISDFVPEKNDGGFLKTRSPPPPTSRAPPLYLPDQDRRFYRLSFHKTHRDLVGDSYLEFVLNQGKEIRVRNRQRKLYTNSSGYRHATWSHVVFEHPATFDTMALEPHKKRDIIEDLLTFSRSREFYERIGKAWKRGYLLFGPPGTGKSTLVAAMANLLGYDVYDLELTAVKDNTELRKLLIETTCKSVIVIEDIDCSLDLTGQRKGNKKSDQCLEDSLKEVVLNGHNDNNNNNVNNNDNSNGNCNSRVTLSGLLNFIDGLWSACGGERLIVFTTNYVEKLDPALIRRGRMDKHIELSYCSFEGFKVLAKNYLGLESHERFFEIEGLINEVKITPADVAENLMPKSSLDGPGQCLSNLIRALEEAKEKALKGKKEDCLIVENSEEPV